MNRPDYLKRIDSLRELMAEKGMDAILYEDYENYYYFTGYTEEEGYVLITANKVYVVVDS